MSWCSLWLTGTASNEASCSYPSSSEPWINTRREPGQQTDEERDVRKANELNKVEY